VVAAGEHRGRDVGLASRGDEGDARLGERGQVVIGDELGVADHEETPLAGDPAERLHRGDNLGDLTRSAVEDAVKDR